jgi:NAD(P)-dependent dehydrogenase (short-subunit alcohol dehydrogenase family)
MAKSTTLSKADIKKYRPEPVYDNGKPGFERLKGKKAIITGGDSGIGRSVAISFAKEGADLLIVYRSSENDAQETVDIAKQFGVNAIKIAADLSKETNCKKVITSALNKLGGVNILVNNAAVQYPQKNIEDIKGEELIKTFSTNILSHIYLAKYLVPHLREGDSIINTSSVNAFRGHSELMDYSSSKGAIIAFTRSLSQSLAHKGIRVNAVAPGPVWTPLIPATFPNESLKTFGKDTPIGRAAQPFEIAPCYVFLACDESVFITGQTLHPNGGTVVNA